jgi:predicted DNA-binding mobile mystery protein A
MAPSKTAANSPETRKLARHRLDETGDLLRALAPRARLVPRGGWISAIRQALGMTLGDLGQRLAISAVAVAKLEESERKHTIQLGSLQRVAAALNCELVYALVPREPLEEMVWKERLRQLDILHAHTAHHMHLEDQSIDGPAYRAYLQNEAGALVPDHMLWKGSR